MRLLRALLGSLLWILAGVLGLVGVLCCVTVILLPLGIPVLMLARKLFKYSMTLFLPREVRHPLKSLTDAAPDVDVGKTRKKLGKKTKKAKKSATKTVRRQRKRLPV